MQRKTVLLVLNQTALKTCSPYSDSAGQLILTHLCFCLNIPNCTKANAGPCDFFVYIQWLPAAFTNCTAALDMALSAESATSLIICLWCPGNTHNDQDITSLAKYTSQDARNVQTDVLPAAFVSQHLAAKKALMILVNSEGCTMLPLTTSSKFMVAYLQQCWLDTG